jgi:hypothetical protein
MTLASVTLSNQIYSYIYMLITFYCRKCVLSSVCHLYVTIFYFLSDRISLLYNQFYYIFSAIYDFINIHVYVSFSTPNLKQMEIYQKSLRRHYWHLTLYVVEYIKYIYLTFIGIIKQLT